jgi:peptide/nickel transport system substrate-binding protein
VWRIVPDGTAETTELQTGNAHIAMSLRVEQAVAAVRDADLRMILRESPQYGFVGWNGRRKPLNEVRVRQAFALALDRVEMINVLRAGHGTLASGPIGQWHWAFDASLSPVPFAPDSARTLLAAAGLQDRDGDGMRELADGSPLHLTLKVPAGSGYNRDLGEMIVADLRAVGIAMDLVPTEWSTMISDVTSPQRSFDAVLMGWETDFKLDLRTLFHSALIDNPYQFAAYANPVADSLLDLVAQESDRDVARQAYHRLQLLLRDEQPWGFLYYYPDIYVASAHLRGVDMDIRGRLVNLPRWWLVGAGQSAGADTK